VCRQRVVRDSEKRYSHPPVRAEVRAKMRGAFLLVGAVLFGCGGALPVQSEPLSTQAEDVVKVVITPTEDERQGGGKVVVIDSSEAVREWTSSPAFAATGWQANDDQSPPRYEVSFRGESGEVARFFMGTLKGEPDAYLCYGFCAKWWTAPALADGSPDRSRYRIPHDDVWYELARQWYLSSK
jgi:hypothetical protein